MNMKSYELLLWYFNGAFMSFLWARRMWSLWSVENCMKISLKRFFNNCGLWMTRNAFLKVTFCVCVTAWAITWVKLLSAITGPSTYAHILLLTLQRCENSKFPSECLYELSYVLVSQLFISWLNYMTHDSSQHSTIPQSMCANIAAYYGERGRNSNGRIPGE